MNRYIMPCPGCGKVPSVSLCYSTGDGHGHSVSCPHCRTHGEHGARRYAGPWARTETGSIRKWNQAMKNTTDDRDEKVNRILHNAEHAESGAAFAFTMGDAEASTRLGQKSIRLRAEAETLDPKHEAPAWAEDAKWRAK